jgi:hypothetical protein
MSGQLLHPALAYVQAGYEVFPLRGKIPHANCPQCDPRSPRYSPHTAADCAHELCHGLLAATSDLARVTRWWSRWPSGNIGARVPKTLLVLDIDPRHHGDQTLARLEDANGPLPVTRTSYSGREDGGRHLWFLHPGGTPSSARLGDGLDIKTHSGYVVLPPSLHPATRRPYWWADPLVAPAPIPAWLLRLLLPPAPTIQHQTVQQRRPPRLRGGVNVADEYAAQTSWADILEPHGWTSPDNDSDADGTRWRHPNATHKVSATIRHGLLFVYSQATAFEATEASHPHGYTKLRALAVLEHGGDLAAAARAVRARMVML